LASVSETKQKPVEADPANKSPDPQKKLARTGGARAGNFCGESGFFGMEFNLISPTRLKKVRSHRPNFVAQFFKTNLRLVRPFELAFPLLEFGSGRLHVHLFGRGDQAFEFFFFKDGALDPIRDWIRAISQKLFVFNGYSQLLEFFSCHHISFGKIPRRAAQGFIFLLAFIVKVAISWTIRNSWYFRKLRRAFFKNQIVVLRIKQKVVMQRDRFDKSVVGAILIEILHGDFVGRAAQLAQAEHPVFFGAVNFINFGSINFVHSIKTFILAGQIPGKRCENRFCGEFRLSVLHGIFQKLPRRRCDLNFPRSRSEKLKQTFEIRCGAVRP